jgi:hypothetical protein
MSLEAWGDDPSDGLDGYITEERGEDLFRGGLQAMREMLARFVEQGGDSATAASIRTNWNPSWGPDPGQPEEIAKGPWEV